MSRVISVFAVAAPLCLALTGSVSAASFNCHKAKTDTEKAICASPRLGVLDQRTDSAFRRLLALVGFSGQRDQFRADEAAWLNTRDACGSDAACLRDNYYSRIDELNGYISTVKATKAGG